jgi:hypothetical protein
MSFGKIGILSLLLFAAAHASAAIFDTLKTVPQDQRVKLAREIYKREVRRTDSIAAFTGFEELFSVARELKDKPLECAAYEFQADYFSVNRGFNTQSPQYYQKAIDFAAKSDLPVETAIYTYKKGSFYYTFKHYAEAYRYSLEAYALLKTAGLENVPDVTTHLNNIANFHYHLDDVATAQNILLEALRFKCSSTSEEVNMTNTLALTYQRLGDDKLALAYFMKAFRTATTTKDSAWMGIVSGNIGAIFFREKQYSEAIPKLAFDYEQSMKYEQLYSAGTALLTLIKCHLAEKEITQAKILLAQSEPLIKKVDELVLWIDYYDAMALLYEKTNQPKIALAYRKQYSIAKDSLEVINNRAAVNQVKLKWEMDKYMAEVNKLKADAGMEVFKRNALIAVLFLLMVISILTYNRQVLKRRKEKEIFEKQEALLLSEKIRTEGELFHASQALAQYTENLKEKNDLIEEFTKEVEHLQLQLGSPADKEKIEHLEKLMQAHIMTDETWDEFKRLFEKVHTGFILRLKEKFVQITETDIRLLTLVKLGLSNREMSNMLGVTNEAIKKSRQRLRKKINLPDDQSLEEVVAGI